MKKTTVLKAVITYAILAMLTLLAINTFFVCAAMVIERGWTIEMLDQRSYEQLMTRLFNSSNPITRIIANRELSDIVRVATALITMSSPFIFFFGVRKYNSRRK